MSYLIPQLPNCFWLERMRSKKRDREWFEPWTFLTAFTCFNHHTSYQSPSRSTVFVEFDVLQLRQFHLSNKPMKCFTLSGGMAPHRTTQLLHFGQVTYDRPFLRSVANAIIWPDHSMHCYWPSRLKCKNTWSNIYICNHRFKLGRKNGSFSV